MKSNVYVTTLCNPNFNHLYGIKNQQINMWVVSG